MAVPLSGDDKRFLIEMTTAIMRDDLMPVVVQKVLDEVENTLLERVASTVTAETIAAVRQECRAWLSGQVGRAFRVAFEEQPS